MSAVSWKMGRDTAPFIYANNEPKSALARDLGDCRDNKGKLAKRVFACLPQIKFPSESVRRKEPDLAVKTKKRSAQQVRRPTEQLPNKYHICRKRFPAV